MYAAKYVLTAKGNGKNLMTDESERRRQEGSNPPPSGSQFSSFNFLLFYFSNSLCDIFIFYIRAAHFSEHAQRQNFNKVGVKRG